MWNLFTDFYSHKTILLCRTTNLTTDEWARTREKKQDLLSWQMKIIYTIRCLLYFWSHRQRNGEWTNNYTEVLNRYYIYAFMLVGTLTKYVCTVNVVCVFVHSACVRYVIAKYWCSNMSHEHLNDNKKLNLFFSLVFCVSEQHTRVRVNTIYSATKNWNGIQFNPCYSFVVRIHFVFVLITEFLVLRAATCTLHRLYKYCI